MIAVHGAHAWLPRCAPPARASVRRLSLWVGMSLRDDTIRLVHEDEDFFFVHKPHGVVVAGDGSSDTFHEQVKRHARVHYACDALNLLHRLDKGTSGVMVYAKSAEAAKYYLRLQDQRGAITKDYLAVVRGAPPRAAGRVAGGICPSRDRTSYVIRGKGSGKAVLTTYRLLASECHSRLGKLSGLSLRLFSGRKHQIRASCRHLGCPIVGDDRYGGPAYGAMLLHARRSAFVGRNGQPYDVSCDPLWTDDSLWREPEDAAFFAGLLASLGAEGAVDSTDAGERIISAVDPCT